MIEVTARRLEGTEGTNGHENIASLRWVNPVDGSTGENTLAGMVDWIDNKGGKVFVRVGDAKATVAVVHGKPSYLRTHYDNQWSDHLLELPDY